MSLLLWLIVNYTAKKQQIFQERHPITSIYQKFLETSSAGDHAHTGRSSIEQILDNELVNSVRSMAREANISRYQAHQIM